MAQKLILPINKCKLTASYKNTAYYNKYGFTHYGIDMVSSVGSTTIYASGTGTVVAKGWDSQAGYVVVVKYPQALCRTDNKYRDVIIRYYHLNSINSSLGTSVTKDTVLGNYGGSGFGSMTKWDPHLHIEIDTDTAYPCYSPTFSGSGTIIKAGNDATMFSPLLALYVKDTSPDYQTYITAGNVYINSGDGTLPKF